MGKRRNSQVKRRKKLFLEDPHCHWCGQEVVEITATYGMSLPPNMATLDHLHDRIEHVKGRPVMPLGTSVTVLACRSCNEKRAAERIRLLGKEEWRKRSGNVTDNWAKFRERQLVKNANKIRVGQLWRDKKTGDEMMIYARAKDRMWQCSFARSKVQHKMRDATIRKFYEMSTMPEGESDKTPDVRGDAVSVVPEERDPSRTV